jgi:hypothetical protein
MAFARAIAGPVLVAAPGAIVSALHERILATRHE